MSTPDRSGDRLVRRSSAAPQRSDGVFTVEQPESVIGAPVRQEPQPNTSFFRRHQWPLSIGAGLVALGGSAAAVVFASGDGSGDGGVNVVFVDKSATVQDPTAAGTTKTSEATPSPTATPTGPRIIEPSLTPTATVTPTASLTEVSSTSTPKVEMTPVPLSEIVGVVQRALASAGVQSDVIGTINKAIERTEKVDQSTYTLTLNTWSGALQAMIPIACLNQEDESVKLATYSLAAAEKQVFDKAVEAGAFKDADWEVAWNVIRLAMLREGCELSYLDRFDPAKRK